MGPGLSKSREFVQELGYTGSVRGGGGHFYVIFVDRSRMECSFSISNLNLVT